MNQYEIMLILAPNENESLAQNLLNAVFGSKNVEKFSVLEQTELAYEINKSKIAKYVLAIVKSNVEDDLVKEFTRRANIEKKIWRHLIINLTTERGLGKANTPKKFQKRFRDANNADGNVKEYRYRRDNQQSDEQNVRANKSASSATGDKPKYQPRKTTDGSQKPVSHQGAKKFRTPNKPKE